MPAVSCWVPTKAKPKLQAAANAKPTPSPMLAHWACAPKPEAAPSTSSAMASPSKMSGMASSTLRWGVRL